MTSSSSGFGLGLLHGPGLHRAPLRPDLVFVEFEPYKHLAFDLELYGFLDLDYFDFEHYALDIFNLVP